MKMRKITVRKAHKKSSRIRFSCRGHIKYQRTNRRNRLQQKRRYPIPRIGTGIPDIPVEVPMPEASGTKSTPNNEQNNKNT